MQGLKQWEAKLVEFELQQRVTELQPLFPGTTAPIASQVLGEAQCPPLVLEYLFPGGSSWSQSCTEHLLTSTARGFFTC